MNCGRFEPIFWDESKLHPCEVCHGTAHFVIKSDGYFAVQCESCGSFLGEPECSRAGCGNRNIHVGSNGKSGL